MHKKLLVSFTLFGVFALAVASSGGGGSKKRSSINSAFTPINHSNTFTLKTGPQFSMSHIFSSQKNNGIVSYNTIVTYQKGNTTYILPYTYKMNAAKPCFKSNLNVVDLKFRLRK